ncbi:MULTISPECIES: Hsp20/alpha crystallin family protein [Bacillus]|uniref:Hsp20/alpha crystallin family protein n=1 Tax=Bacillus TaxID=1386 RepID=UPI0002EFFD89|nr:MULTISPECIES: Hsp20/alpha crystallin family protein [Bacillus]
MSADKKTNKLPSKRNKNDPFFDFVTSMDHLFSGKPLGGFLQTMDGFFQNSGLNKSFPIEMTEEKHAYIIKAKLPGINKQQINIEAFKQSLQISVQHNESLNQHDSKGNTISSQKTSKTITRSITFVKPINDKGVQAEHRDGLLEITVPKIKGKEVKIIN